MTLTPHTTAASGLALLGGTPARTPESRPYPIWSEEAKRPHGKNFSLLYLPSKLTTALAPAYDLLSTVAYSRRRKMSRKMAMSIGGEYRADYVRDRHSGEHVRADRVGRCGSAQAAA